MNLRNSTGNSPNCVRFWVFFFHPPNLWVCWLGISIYDVLFSLTITFFHTFFHRSHPYNHPTNHQPPPTTTTPSPKNPPTTKPHQYSTLTAQNNLGELFALLKFLWPDVMAKESEAWRRKQKISWISGCYGWHTLPETNITIENPYLFW